jgi:chaperonin GroEL (HSP60 family)
MTSYRGREAYAHIRQATTELAGMTWSMYGPGGQTKLVVYPDANGRQPEEVVTESVDVFLDALDQGDLFAHPVAAMLVDSVDSMQRGQSDGTNRTLLLAGALVDRGVALIEEGTAPITVLAGYSRAAHQTGEILDDQSEEWAVDCDERLRNLARTALTADVGNRSRSQYSEQIATAVRRLYDATDGEWVDTDNVKVISGRSDEQGRYVNGVVVRRRPIDEKFEETDLLSRRGRLRYTESVEDVRVAIVDREIDFEKTGTVLGGRKAGVQLDSPEDVFEYAAGVDEQREAAARHLETVGVDLLVTQENVEKEAADAFRRHGVHVVDNVKTPLSDVYRVERATGSTVVAHVNDLTSDDVGTAGSVVEYRVCDETWTVLDDCGGGLSTIVVEPATEGAAERHVDAVEDAIEVTATAAMDRQVIPGAGASAMAVATGLRDYATTIPEREQLAVDAFADAVEQLVYVLAENAGLDPLDSLTRLRTAQTRSGDTHLGLDLATGDPTDAMEAGVIEPRRVLSQAIETARVAVSQLLTADTVLYPNVNRSQLQFLSEHD